MGLVYCLLPCCDRFRVLLLFGVLAFGFSAGWVYWLFVPCILITAGVDAGWQFCVFGFAI